jgi:hypothetical protein
MGRDRRSTVDSQAMTQAGARQAGSAEAPGSRQIIGLPIIFFAPFKESVPAISNEIENRQTILQQCNQPTREHPKNTANQW